MNFKPIIFSTPMIQAILSGRKSVTRRVVKLKHLLNSEIGSINKTGGGKTWVAWSPLPVSDEDTKEAYPNNEGFKCPYGEPGDVLWCRESFQYIPEITAKFPAKFVYKADNFGRDTDKWRPSIHMPKSACRIFLKIESIRVERLQEITEEEAIKEGVDHGEQPQRKNIGGYAASMILDAKSEFYSLWCSINGEESLELNPFVWVIHFSQTERPENF